MTTAADWVEDTRERLEGDHGGRFNRLADDYAAGSGTLVLLRDLAGIGAGTVVSVGLNTFLVEVASSNAKKLTVIGGHARSVDTDLPSGSLVRVGPRFTDHRIFRALNDSLASMSNPRTGLYAVNTTEIVYDGTREGYGLTAPRFLDVLEARRQTYGPDVSWPRVPPREWDLVRSADDGDFPTGLALRLRGCVDAGAAVRVTYKAGFAPLASLADDVTVTGLHVEAQDIPPLSAAIRVMSGREVGRTDPRAQPDPRRAEEIPPGATTNSVAGLRVLETRRIAEEASRLRSRYPIGM